MNLRKKLSKTQNIIILIAAIIIIVIIGILAREQIKNKWISKALFGNKKLMIKEDFSGTLQQYRVDTGVYALTYNEGAGHKIKTINHNDSHAAFGENPITTSYNIDNTIFYSKPKDKWYSLKTGREYDWSYFKLGMTGHIKVVSGAGSGGQPWFVSFKNNGHDIQGEGNIGSRGLNFIAIPPYGSGRPKRQAFDALGSGGFRNQINNFIDNTMPDHSIFLFSVLDESGEQNYRHFYDQLSDKIASDEFKSMTWRASFAYIGIKLGDNNYEKIKEKREADGSARSTSTFVETHLNQYYIFPTRAGTDPVRQGPLQKHRSVNYVNVLTRNYGYHNIPDGEYTIQGRNYDIYVAQIPNNIQQYNIYKVHGPDGRRMVTREPDGQYTIMGVRHGSEGNYHYNVNIFKADGNFYASNAVLRDRKIDNNITIQHNGRTKHNYLIQDSNSKYLGFEPVANAPLKVYSHSTPDTVLKVRPEHLIVKMLKYDNVKRHAIVFFTGKKVLFVKPDGSLGLEDITDSDIVKDIRQHDNINNHARYSNDKYKFEILPVPLETVTGGSSQQTVDGSVIIFQRSVAPPAANLNYTGKITYRYLAVNGDTVRLVTSTSFRKPGSELGNEYKFKFTEITDTNGDDGLDAALVNYYRTSSINSVDFVHINNNRDNPDRESNCRFYNLHSDAKFNQNVTPNGEGCKDYKPTYIERRNNHNRLVAADYGHTPNKKIASGNPALATYNNKSIKECMQICDADDRCYVFSFRDNLGNNPDSLGPVTLGECKTYIPGDLLNSPSDEMYDIYNLTRAAEIRQIEQRPVPTATWSAQQKAYTSSPCSASTNQNSCATMSDTCRFARGRCNPLCENTDSGCVSNALRTIGSVSDFNISLALELIGTSQIKTKISNVEPVDNTKNFSFPIIRSNGITVEFVKAGSAEYSSDRDDNKKITVGYTIDYSTNASQYKFINPNDEFIIDIPPVLCSPDCGKLREHGIKIIFTDIYGRTKSFQQFLPPEVVSSTTQPTTTRPHDDRALQQVRINQQQIGGHIGN